MLDPTAADVQIWDHFGMAARAATAIFTAAAAAEGEIDAQPPVEAIPHMTRFLT
ncbi:hypothetical protein ACW9HJ_30120 [Nocardia gipuzkoensis]